MRNEMNVVKTVYRSVFVAIAALLIASSVLGCKKEPVERTPAEHQEDQKLAEQVKAAFATSPSFKFPDVQVAAFRGTLQLSGFVVSDDQKQAAESLAKGVPGVQSVENKISLKN
ncbi:MAG: BON domain-containing protein [Chthoniobacterales bacterium]